jgi:hypothetical protein
MKKEINVGLPLETKVEVVAINGKGVAIKKEMLYKEFLSLKTKRGYTYYAFQLGFSQFNN